MQRPIAGFVLLLAAGCSTAREYVRPTERVTAESFTGYPAAEYDLQRAGRHVGEVKIWSRGAARQSIDGVRRTVIHVALEVENTGQQPLSIDPASLRLQQIQTNERVVPDTTPFRTRGTPSVPPGRTEVFEAFFALPADVTPQDVDAFRLQWSVQIDGQRYAQITPFIEFSPAAVRYYTYGPYYGFYPYYDPFYGPYGRYHPGSGRSIASPYVYP